MEKYELLKDDTIQFGTRALYRIKALKDFGDVKTGDLGGYVETKFNLSQDGVCWIYNDAQVYGAAQVADSARIWGDACVLGVARVYGAAQVFGNARVYGNALIFGNARVYENAYVLGIAQVHGDAQVSGHATIRHSAEIWGQLSNKAEKRYVCISNIGSRNDTTTFFLNTNSDICVTCGCFHGTLDEFEDAVIITHKNNKYAQEYMQAIQFAKNFFKIQLGNEEQEQ